MCFTGRCWQNDTTTIVAPRRKAPEAQAMPELSAAAGRSVDEDAAVADMLNTCTQGNTHG